MSRSLRVDQEYIGAVKAAVRRNGFHSQRELAETLELALATVNNFLNGKPVDRAIFEDICTNLALDWKALTTLETEPLPPSPRSLLFPASIQQDWGDAPDLSVFYGRINELDALTQWIAQDRCRLVSILGMGGMGKTSLAAKLAKQLAAMKQTSAEYGVRPYQFPANSPVPAPLFEYVIWRSLLNAPPIEEILRELIQFLSNQEEIHLPDSLEGRLSCLMHYLRQHRCLIVFDNFESVLQGGTAAGRYSPHYEGYGRLLQRMGESLHQSSLILTSREKPREIALAEGINSPVRVLQLRGLTQAEGWEIFKSKGCYSAEACELQALFDHYAGNPLALKMVASCAWELVDGAIEVLIPGIQQSRFQFSDINDLLGQQFDRLSDVEQQVLYWLAINREPITLAELQADMVSDELRRHLLEAVQSLVRRCLVEQNQKQLFLQPVVMQYVTNRLVIEICDEIVYQRPEQLRDYALLKAQQKDYLRQAQRSLILQPILDRLLTLLGCTQRIEQHFQEILQTLRATSPLQPGYVGGNLLNLLVEMNADLSQFDFSYLTIWQAYLQNAPLHDVNFAHAAFQHSIFSKTFGTVSAVLFSPNGELLAASNANGEIHVWRFLDGQHLFICRGHANWVRRIAFSPDGQYLASASDDRTIKIWDLRDGRCLRTLGREINSAFYGINFSPDGQTLVSAGGDHIARLWDWQTGDCIQEFRGHSNWVLTVVFSPNGRHLASSSCDTTIRIWDIQQGQCLRVMHGHSSWVMPIAFTPDGQRLVSSSLDQTLRIWQVETGACLHVLQGSNRWLWAMALSPDGRRIVSGGEDRLIRIWDTQTGKCLRVIKGHTELVWCVSFHPNGEWFASCSDDQTVRIWHGEGKCLKVIQGHTNCIRSVLFTSNGQQLISGNKDHTIRIWDRQTHQCIHTLEGHTAPVSSIALNAEGRTLASSSEDYTIKLWDLSQQICLQTLRGHTGGIWSVAFSPDGRTLASGSFDQTVRLWDLQQGTCLQKLEGHVTKTGLIHFSPDGAKLAIASGHSEIRIWNIHENRFDTLAGHTNWVRVVAFHPSQPILASGAIDTTIKLWDTQSYTCMQTLQGHAGWILSIAFSPDGQWLASGSCDRTVKIWRVQDGKCVKTLKAHTNWVWSVAFSPDGQTLASASDDGVIKLWNWQFETCPATLKNKRLYEGMNLTGATGLSSAQKASLKALGAVEVSF